ncbi:unnamed protein product [Arabis nemorensis]|uniref:Uncharacterized protein n=1 Tax=Arabis nemorensis TaxID=586526 RepID=A0A565BB22_9BRAS|nr:unnamed protein product [Arabis nemorensis]
MAQGMVKLAFIFAIVFNAPSDVIKAEIVQNRDLKPLLEVGIILATNKNEQAPSRRYGPFIQQPIFSSQGNKSFTMCVRARSDLFKVV